MCTFFTRKCLTPLLLAVVVLLLTGTAVRASDADLAIPDLS